MNALDKLKLRFNSGLRVCIGLDTDIKKIPPHLLKYENPVLEFNKIIIDSTKDFAAGYKMNFAFYEYLGAKGFEILQKTVEYIPDNIFTIADAKFGDIGNTCEKYAYSVFEHFNFDSVTLNPYMGYDSIMPFISYKDKISFVLVLTSNESAEDFEKLKFGDEILFKKVLSKVNDWNSNNNLGIVFGATQTEELKDNIKLFGNLITLVPGIGAQSGNLEEVVSVFKAEGKDYLINISRGIIYCDSSEEFDKKVNTTLKNYTEKSI